MVYAGLDEWSDSLYAFFLYLLHACADLSGAAVVIGNPAWLYGSVFLDCVFIFRRNVSMEKGTKKACCTGRLTDYEKRYYISYGGLHRNHYEIVVSI